MIIFHHFVHNFSVNTIKSSCTLCTVFAALRNFAHFGLCWMFSKFHLLGTVSTEKSSDCQIILLLISRWSGLPVCNVILILTLLVLLLVVYFISHPAILRNPTLGLVWVYNRTNSVDRPRKIFRWTLYVGQPPPLLYELSRFRSSPPSKLHKYTKKWDIKSKFELVPQSQTNPAWKNAYIISKTET